MQLRVENVRKSVKLSSTAQICNAGGWAGGHALNQQRELREWATPGQAMTPVRFLRPQILAKNLADMAVGSLGFYLVGWGLAVCFW